METEWFLFGVNTLVVKAGPSAILEYVCLFGVCVCVCVGGCVCLFDNCSIIMKKAASRCPTFSAYSVEFCSILI
jgi:hypothetical protein